ncbi:MAG: glycosyltransferase family 2 protein, partial [Gammaproteobacteria bacterium]
RGGQEGRAPCAQFDAAWYLGSNPDVQASGANPLLHYLEFGRVEGRAVAPPDGEERAELPAELPPLAASTLDDILPRALQAAPRVDVVVPVYRGLAETVRCLKSVLGCSAATPFELIVIDDASPEPGLPEALDRWAAAGLFTLLRNPVNVGFVGSCNRGMELHADRDVVLLNSDTEVYGDWLDRLLRAAHRDPRNGTVTPLSNNATIASYPRFIQDNPYPLEIGYPELDALAARVNAGVVAEAPTGVGFCIYLRRDCLQQIGFFDEESFGRGYGEENELCQRAIAAGWRNLIAADVFVHHLGSVSFQGERANRVAKAMRVMDRLYPSYQRDVREFIERDPLRAARERLDRARLGLRARERNVLLVCHSRGGGAERHLREETRRLQESGHGVFFLRPVRGDGALARLCDHTNMALPNLGDFVLA